MNTFKIFETNADIKDFFLDSICEVHLLSYILYIASQNHTEKYIEWRQNLPRDEHIYEKYVRLNKIAIHAAKYNKKYIKADGLQTLRQNEELSDKIHQKEIVSYTVHKKQTDDNIMEISRSECDILNCISFHRYRPGTIFNITIWEDIVLTHTVTKENRFDMIVPIKNVLPIYLLCLHQVLVHISSPNTILNKPIYMYTTHLNTELRSEFRYNMGCIRVDNDTVFKYMIGAGKLLKLKN